MVEKTKHSTEQQLVYARTATTVQDAEVALSSCLCYTRFPSDYDHEPAMSANAVNTGIVSTTRTSHTPQSNSERHNSHSE